MEDAHITITNLQDDPSVTEKVLSVFQSVNDNVSSVEKPKPTISLFGVFDGHGGDEFELF